MSLTISLPLSWCLHHTTCFRRDDAEGKWVIQLCCLALYNNFYHFLITKFQAVQMFWITLPHSVNDSSPWWNGKARTIRSRIMAEASPFQYRHFCGDRPGLSVSLTGAGKMEAVGYLPRIVKCLIISSHRLLPIICQGRRVCFSSYLECENCVRINATLIKPAVPGKEKSAGQTSKWGDN